MECQIENYETTLAIQIVRVGTEKICMLQLLQEDELEVNMIQYQKWKFKEKEKTSYQ